MSPSVTRSDPSDAAPAALKLNVSDTAVARVAAYYASRVPGVRRLRPDLAQTIAGLAPRLIPPRNVENQIPSDGVTAAVDDDRAEISITLVTRWGRNCRDVAEQVQDHVAEQVCSYTGLAAAVSITIAQVDYDA